MPSMMLWDVLLLAGRSVKEARSRPATQAGIVGENAMLDVHKSSQRPRLVRVSMWRWSTGRTLRVDNLAVRSQTQDLVALLPKICNFRLLIYRILNLTSHRETIP